MKKYNTPIMNISLFETENVVTTSGGSNAQNAKDDLTSSGVLSNNITETTFTALHFVY